MFKISLGNSKLGKIANINLPAVLTCAIDAPCRKTCYACKGTYLYKNVRERYIENYKTYVYSPLIAYNDLYEQLKAYKGQYVRWHSSGDIIDMNYFKMMIKLATVLPHLKFLCFTKKYDIVNAYIDSIKGYEHIPYNLNIVFSLWQNYPCNNYYALPVALVSEFMTSDKEVELYKWFECEGSCINCKKCWHLKSYQAVLFHQH